MSAAFKLVLKIMKQEGFLCDDTNIAVHNLFETLNSVSEDEKCSSDETDGRQSLRRKSLLVA